MVHFVSCLVAIFVSRASGQVVDVAVVNARGQEVEIRFDPKIHDPSVFCATYANMDSMEYCVENLERVGNREARRWQDIETSREKSVVISPIASSGQEEEEIYQRLMRSSFEEPHVDKTLGRNTANLLRSVLRDRISLRYVQMSPYYPGFVFVAPERSSDATANPRFYSEETSERFFFMLFLSILAFRRKVDGDLVIDVGMNYGFYTLAAAAMDCNVLSFEVQPKCFDYAKTSTAANGFEDNVTFFHRAVGLPSTILSIPSNQCSGTFSIASGDDRRSSSVGEGRAAVRVETTTLDDVLEQVRGGRVRLLKIDAEGSELSILSSSAVSVLKHVQHILVEMTPKKWQGDLTKATNRIRDSTNGFVAYALLHVTSYLSTRFGLGPSLEFRREARDLSLCVSSTRRRASIPSQRTDTFDIAETLNAHTSTRGARLARVLDWDVLLSHLKESGGVVNAWFVARSEQPRVFASCK